MAEFDPSIGIDAAAKARSSYLEHAGYVPGTKDIFGHDEWADSWKDLAMQYAFSEYEFGQNKEMWELMNEYNSPSSQMQRLKEAGLNPMLAYQSLSSGQASSPVSYNSPRVHMTPDQDRLQKLNGAIQTIGMLNNVFQNICSMFDSSLDIAIKRNELAYSDYDRRLLEHWAPNGSLALSNGRLWSEHQQEKLNPFSPNFDPFMFEFLSKRGSLPQFYSNWYYNIPKKDYTEAKTLYQNYYNKHILPLFEDYQQNKIDLQDLEERFKQYEYDSMTMIPAELRGILQPIVQYISPFLKFIFKSSRGTFSHTVKQ